MPADVAAERLRSLQTIQEEVTADRNAAMVGRQIEVVVDQVEDGTAVARSYREAPEIDGVILLDEGSPGEWMTARVTGAYGPELAGEAVR